MLPIARRIDYKLATIVYKTRATQEPQYLNSLLIDYVPGRNLRSMSQQGLTVPVIKLKPYPDGFLCTLLESGTVCHWMSETLSASSLLEKNLKTYYFGVAYKDK